jgi:anaerobic selenocysteine-containing dehydrogenase
MELFSALGRAAGFEHPAFELDGEALLRTVVGEVRIPGGTPDGDTVAAGGQVRYDFPGENPIQFETVFPRTANRRAQLTPTALGDRPYAWTPPGNDFPLALITPASAHLVTSTMGEYNLDTLRVTLHPADAAARKLAHGARVRVFNRRGEVHCLLAVSDSVRPGVAAMPKGAWRRSSINGATSVVLCPDDAQVVGNAACFNDARVDVAALDQSSR